MISKGLLNVTLVDLELTRDTEMFGSMSPYCTLVHNAIKLKTKVQANAGKLPKFNEDF